MVPGQPTPAAELPPARGRSRLVASIATQLGSAREAAWIVEQAAAELGRGRGDDRRAGDRTLDGRRLELVARGLADRRAAGEPLQYVLGHWQFRSVELKVDPRVLIPRPETEQVVQVALGQLERMSAGPLAGANGGEPAGGPGPSRVCVDLGTGSGAIALSLATEGAAGCSELEVWATDRSTDALEVAGENLRALSGSDGAAAGRVRLVEGSWFDALPPELAGRVDLMVSNPPYVSESEYSRLEPVVRDWEPRGALVASTGAGGVGGMAAIETIIAGARRWLRRSGALVVEIAPSQAEASVEAARRAGFGQVATERDLAGRQRMLVAGH
jgi:release factor glutamine methyltransferase